jgi:hypothetical protein
MPRILFCVPLLLVAGCVTNISSKAAEQCAPVSATAELYAECVSGVSAELQAKNRNTARILAAGLGGAANSYQPTGGSSGAGFLKSSYVSGFNRICVYDQLGSELAVTIGSTQLCPLALP